MEWYEYKEKFSNEKLAEESLKTEFFLKFKEAVNQGKVKFNSTIQGHKFVLGLDDIVKEDTRMRYFTDNIIDMIIYADDKISFLRTLNLKEKIKSPDIDKLLKGNLEWIDSKINGLPFDVSRMTCLNDGKKYISELKDWSISFVTKIKNKKTPMIPYANDNAALEFKANIPTGDVVAMNFLPRDMDDFIFNQFKTSQYSLNGRDWQEFMSEGMNAFGVVRTPTHIGGSLFPKKDGIITGYIDYEDIEDHSTHKYVETDVWQTLMVDKQNLLKLFMLTYECDYARAEECFEELKEEQHIEEIKINPGDYYFYFIPEMNDGDDTQPTFGNENIIPEHVNPEGILINHKLTLNKMASPSNFITENEKSKCKEMLDSVSLHSSLKM